MRVAGHALFGLSTAVVVFSLAGSWALTSLRVADADYGRIARVMAMANIVLASGASLAWLWAAQGLPRAAALLVLCALIAGGMEAVGVATGIPFGAYQYTDQLGPRLGGIVPAVIPLAWLMMVYPALHVAQQTRLRPAGKAALVGLAMVTWDLVLDPAMTTGLRAWEWQEGGLYFGIPARNYLGWFLTAFILAWVFLHVPGDWRSDGSRMPVANYLVQSLFPALLAVLYCRPWAAVAWLAALLLLWALTGRLATPAEASRTGNGSA